MKIITGKLKGKRISTSHKFDYRPTTSRVREAIFSIISSGDFIDQNPLKNAKTFDAFGGTGILSFEAISRGALQATINDINRAHLAAITDNAEKLGIKNQTKFTQFNATELPFSNESFDIIFIDPPFNKDLTAKAIFSMEKNNYLKKGSLIIVETHKNEQYETS